MKYMMPLDAISMASKLIPSASLSTSKSGTRDPVELRHDGAASLLMERHKRPETGSILNLLKSSSSSSMMSVHSSGWCTLPYIVPADEYFSIRGDGERLDAALIRWSGEVNHVFNDWIIGIDVQSKNLEGSSVIVKRNWNQQLTIGCINNEICSIISTYPHSVSNDYDIKYMCTRIAH